MPLETITRALLLPILLVVSGCSLEGPALAGYPGLQFQVVSYYDNNALEMNATCTQPRMRAVTGTRIIDETPDRSSWRSAIPGWTKARTTMTAGACRSAGLAFKRCSGFAERTFTFAKLTDGNLSVRSMTGPQRRQS